MQQKLLLGFVFQAKRLAYVRLAAFLDLVSAVLTNALLFQSRYAEAESIYRQFKGQPYDEKRSWTDVFMEDLDALEAAGITHPDVKKARVFLKE